MSKLPVGYLRWALVIALTAIISCVGTWAVLTYTAPTPGPTTPTTIHLKAAWIYVGPIGDYGWTHAHDVGRRYVDALYPWLETYYVESVKEANCPGVIDQLVAQGYTVIFTTSFGFMDATLDAAKKYPNVIFFHCSGYKRWDNMGTYFAEFYQLYYLNGLMAGALTKTGKAGYVAAHPIPEVIRHINAFAIGFAEVAEQRYARGELPNPPEVHVVWIYEWYNPAKAREAAESLITKGCDVLAFTEDSPTVVTVCEEHYKRGEPIYTFAHYSPMYAYGPDVVVSGQLVHWEVIYADIIAKIASGVYTTENLKAVDYWWMLHEGAVELGCNYSMPINPKFEAPLKSVTVVDKLTNETMTVYDLVFLRLEQMKDETPHVQVISGGEITWLTPNVTFDPFMGPLYDQDGNLRVPAGERLGHDELWTMMWFVKWVIGTIPT
ncbi:BMP family ABC transporter substrate-binding protein [Candidatus Bathyarchaeota archaeon ex4484_135]|nr:MAG: BMP family ABC transporter substrate-binding protein [Candidatus Bathyarchaeota archaeon ex4484_135]